MRVYELRQRTDLTELNSREDVSVVKEQADIDCHMCRTIFARTERGEYVEIWGTRSVRPNEQDDAHAHELDPRLFGRYEATERPWEDSAEPANQTQTHEKGSK
jgi:hypothetical protein